MLEMLLGVAMSALLVPTSKNKTHVLMLNLDYVPSLPLKFKVLAKAEVSGLDEPSPGELPGPDRRLQVVVTVGEMRHFCPSCWSVRQLRDELARLGIDGRGCAEKRELVDLVLVRHQQQSAPGFGLSAQDGGQGAGRATGDADASSSVRAGPSAPGRGRTNFDAAVCLHCRKRRADCHKLFSCSGCKTVYYCSKECQNESWRNGGHKQVCKQTQAAKAIMAEAGQAEMCDAFAKWIKKMTALLNFTANSALLGAGTSRIATHALVLQLDHVPSVPLQFKVQTVEVLTKAEVFATIQHEHEGVMPELPCWDLPDPDRRTAVVVMAGRMRQMLISTLPAETLTEVVSSQLIMPLKACIRSINDPETQRKLKNNEDIS
ncbi:hypothetical protein FOA52_014697 [Chlamydomonas sp. UWO 241]|nr:hypothetical protein FOA52_014697 [Chlamydomonas sp. UWO 241]